MQRLFSMFPSGWPGLGLLLLRVAVAVPVLIEALNGGKRLALWMLIGSYVLSALLCLGILTPIAALLVLAIDMITTGSAPIQVSAAALLNAIALALLGPGAYSWDARRFGRRLLVLPPNGAEPP